MSERAPALSLAAVLAVVVGGHLSLFPRVADLDGFYHVGHAIAYLEGSLFDTSLPWATRSVIGEIGGDLWWGFHVLLIPFGAAGSVAWAMRVAGVTLTLLLALSVFFVLRRHRVAGAGWWAALFLVAVPNIFYRYLMVRPHVVSLAAAIVLLSVLVRGRWWQVALASAAIAWVHLSLAWLGPSVAVAYAIVRVPATVLTGRDAPDAGVPIRQAVPAALLGMLAGWALRPDALAAATLVNVQLVQLFALKATEAPVTFAQELDPIGGYELLLTAGLFLAAWAVGLASLGRSGLDIVRGGESEARWTQERATLAATAAAISMVFLAIAMISARRALELWAAFGFLLLPFLWPGRRGLRPGARTLLLVLLVGHLGWSGWRHSLNLEAVAFPADRLRGAAEFLERAGRPGDIVFHARWDNFGPLLAHNRTSRYLGGMDPIFLYASDPASFWRFFYLSSDASWEWTCATFPCTQDATSDTYDALRNDFGARWVLVEPYRNPRLTLYLLNDPRYELALETQHEAVFEIREP